AKYLKNLEIVGCFSHISNCFGKNNKSVLLQLERFQKCCAALKDAEIDPGLLHIAASNAAILYPKARLGAVRCGSALLGRVGVPNQLGLQKVGELSCPISDIRWLPAKHSIGYGNTYITKKATRIAIIQTGYADGLFVEKKRDAFRTRDILRDGWHDLKALLLRRPLYCTINGQRCRLLGRIGMCSIVVDVSKVQCDPGTPAIFDTSPLMVNANVERVYR
ncbi:MAG TPA: hypothetical protein DEP42_05165, partial [Ruminococcaceae bacterium]|nr:hypothetical protein [Oscillospiraceae bacterium]